MSKEKKLKIGDYLYRSTNMGLGSSVWAFKIIGVREYSDNTQYHVVCEACTDHEPCQLLVTYYEDGAYRLVCMLNNRGSEFDEDNQEYWHNVQELFYLDRNIARRRQFYQVIDNNKKHLKEAQSRLSNVQSQIKDLETRIKHDQEVVAEIEALLAKEQSQ